MKKMKKNEKNEEKCESVYIGKCYRRLEDRVKDHVPASIRRRSASQSQPEFLSIDSLISHYRLRSTNEIVQSSYYVDVPKSGSAIRMNLLENPACANAYDESCFKILATAKSKFHLDVLESVFINT